MPWQLGLKGEHKVLEADPDIMCYTGLHLYLTIHNYILVVFFILISGQLQISMGDADYLISGEGWSTWQRLCNRMNVTTWTALRSTIWPRYSGNFALHRHAYFFEA